MSREYNKNGVVKDPVGVRDLAFSEWIRNNLPNTSTGQLVTDLDFIVSNYKTKQILMLEVKTRNASLKKHQRITFSEISNTLRIGYTSSDWRYYGFHFLVFERTCFEDGKAFLNNKPITERELIDFLSFKTVKEPETQRDVKHQVVTDLDLETEKLKQLGFGFKDDIELPERMCFRRDAQGWWFRQDNDFRFIARHNHQKCAILEKIHLAGKI